MDCAPLRVATRIGGWGGMGGCGLGQRATTPDPASRLNPLPARGSAVHPRHEHHLQQCMGRVTRTCAADVPLQVTPTSPSSRAAGTARPSLAPHSTDEGWWWLASRCACLPLSSMVVAAGAALCFSAAPPPPSCRNHRSSDAARASLSSEATPLVREPRLVGVRPSAPLRSSPEPHCFPPHPFLRRHRLASSRSVHVRLGLALPAPTTPAPGGPHAAVGGTGWKRVWLADRALWVDGRTSGRVRGGGRGGSCGPRVVRGCTPSRGLPRELRGLGTGQGSGVLYKAASPPRIFHSCPVAGRVSRRFPTITTSSFAGTLRVLPLSALASTLSASEPTDTPHHPLLRPWGDRRRRFVVLERGDSRCDQGTGPHPQPLGGVYVHCSSRVSQTPAPPGGLIRPLLPVSPTRRWRGRRLDGAENGTSWARY